MLRRRSHFEIVEGSVTTVSRTKSAIYLNFGNDWKTDFTARIGKPVLDANPAFDQTLASLEGKTISVRGWIERRNGPMIDILDPAQITIDGDLAQPDLAVSERGEPNSTDSVVAPHADVPAAPASEILKNKRPAFVLPKPPGDVDL